MRETRERKILLTLLLLTLMALVGVLFLDAIPQDGNYHNFADNRKMFHIENFWNVISNLPFLVVGLYALYQLLILKSFAILKEVKKSYLLFFVGVTLVAFGSSYYHLNPNNETLLWDRLPMTIAFMALFSFVIAEFFSIQVGKMLSLPLLFLGMASVLYWFMGELNGCGDLRAYAVVQFLPMLIMPLMFLFFRASFSLVSGYWYLLLCYLLAKLFEHFDGEIYEMLGVISGHSLKHMVSALGIYILVRSFEKREKR